MDIEQIKRLIQLMVENDLCELNVADGENKVFLKRSTGVTAAAEPVLAAAAPAVPAGNPGPAAPAVPAVATVDIKSPMVGTFYAAASPDSEAYLSVGAKVNPDTVACIIEAMKVMNEIKAECSGTVAEVCVKNAQPVEFGQVLFRVRPA